MEWKGCHFENCRLALGVVFCRVNPLGLTDTPNDLIATKLADYFAQVFNSHKYVPPEFSCDHNHVMPKN